MDSPSGLLSGRVNTYLQNIEAERKKEFGSLGTSIAQWEKYNVEVERLGKYIEQASRQFETVVTTRTRALHRPLEKIEQLRQDTGEAKDA